MKGGTLETVTLVAGAYSGVTGAKVSFNHIPLTVNSLTSVSDLKNTTTAFFICEAETIFSKPSFWPIIKSKSSTVTPDSGTHLQPFRSDRVGVPCAWAVAIAVTTNSTHDKINFPSYTDNDLKTARGKVRKQKKFTTISLSNAQHALSSSTNSQHAPTEREGEREERERERERERRERERERGERRERERERERERGEREERENWKDNGGNLIGGKSIHGHVDNTVEQNVLFCWCFISMHSRLRFQGDHIYHIYIISKYFIFMGFCCVLAPRGPHYALYFSLLYL